MGTMGFKQNRGWRFYRWLTRFGENPMDPRWSRALLIFCVVVGGAALVLGLL